MELMRMKWKVEGIFVWNDLIIKEETFAFGRWSTKRVGPGMAFHHNCDYFRDRLGGVRMVFDIS